MDNGWMTLREAAEFLRMSYSHAVRTWATWERFGVKAYQPGKRKKFFDRKQINQMAQKCAIN